MLSEISQKFDDFKKNHPLARKIMKDYVFGKFMLVFVWGLIVWGTIIPYIIAPIILPPFGYFFTDSDTIKPEILGTIPNDGERLNESPDRIIVSFFDNGGSGVNKKVSNMALRGAKQGIIELEDRIIKDNMMGIKLNGTLMPDQYTVYIYLIDRGGNIIQDSFTFYVLENPTINIFYINISANLKEMFPEKYNENNTQTYSHALTIKNNNSIFLENIIFEIQFPGVVTNYTITESDGVFGYNVKLGQAIMYDIYNIGFSNITSCYTKINIKEIAPGGFFVILFFIDSEIEKYDNAMWCRPDIFDSEYNIESDFENEFSCNYDYQEYGFWYHNIKTGNILNKN